MNRYVFINNIKIEYELTIKRVKNINLRIKPDGKIIVSANKYVPYKLIDDFIISKSHFILNALNKYKKLLPAKKKLYFNDEDLVIFIMEYCKKIYPYYQQKGIEFPEIKFKNMKTRWGSCNCSKEIVTFNTQLKYVPTECVKYIILHEFTHFLQPNHSEYFYHELSKVCPQWKVYRKKLKDIII